MVHRSYESPNENTLRIHETLATILQGPMQLLESNLIFWGIRIWNQYMIQVYIAT